MEIDNILYFSVCSQLGNLIEITLEFLDLKKLMPWCFSNKTQISGMHKKSHSKFSLDDKNNLLDE